MRRGVTGVALTALLALWLLTALVASALWPMVTWPLLDVPVMAGLSCLALMAGHYAGDDAPLWCLPLWGFAAFGLLPLAAGMGGVLPWLAGGFTFTLCALLFVALRPRLTSPLSPLLTAVGLWLGSQIFAGALL